MKKLNEDVELAVLKALEGAALSEEELQDLSSITLGDLLSDHELDYVLADKVLSHVDCEIEKQKKQELISVKEIQESTKRNTSRNVKKPTRAQVRNLVHVLVKEAMNR